MKILITGGAGFIGSSLAQTLSEASSNQIIIVDNLSTGYLYNIPISPNVVFINGSVNDNSFMRSVFLRHKFNFVFHYAALVGVERTQSNPINVLSDAEGFTNIFQLSAITGVKRIIFSSSSEVYGEPVEVPQVEDLTPLNSRLPYAVVKNLGEMFAKAYQKEYSMPFTILRFFNTYGPRQSPDFVISKFISAALKGSPLTIYGDGLQSRTFCYIDDNIAATLAILATTHPDESQTVNIGNDSVYSIYHIAETIIRLTGSESKIEFLPPLKEGDMRRREPCIKLMKSYLSRPLITLEDGLKKILDARIS